MVDFLRYLHVYRRIIVVWIKNKQKYVYAQYSNSSVSFAPRKSMPYFYLNHWPATDNSPSYNHDHLEQYMVSLNHLVRVMIVRWQSDQVNTKESILLFVILITRTKEQYRKERILKFCGTVHCLVHIQCKSVAMVDRCHDDRIISNTQLTLFKQKT